MLEFDEKTKAILEIAYTGADFVKRRRLNFEAVRPAVGDTILDLGCGNGFLSQELANAVGPTGRVIGVDPSADMLQSAKERCANSPQVELHEGFADAIPLSDNSVDAVVSVQVFEYIPDLAAAVAEVARVLKPGGRVAIGDMHFDTWAWHSADEARMSAMMESWDQHLAHRDVPAQLPQLFAAAGLIVEELRPMTFIEHQLKADGMARMLTILMSAFAIQNKHLPEETVNAWLNEQTALESEGRFFHAITHVVVTGRKPDA